MRRAAIFALLAVLIVACGGDGSAGPAGPDRFNADRAFRDLRAQVAIGPRPSGSPGSRRAARLIASRLRDAGARGVLVQRPWRNVVARIPGDRPGAVVVGAHYDTKDDVGRGFEGANDNASGVAVVLELARAIAADAPLRGPSLHLALFDAEEARGERDFSRDGLRGSRQYVEYASTGGRQGAPELGAIEAMVLFDLVGDCDLHIPREENSAGVLYAAFADAAREATGSAGSTVFGGRAVGVVDDHVPFIEAGVPSVNLIDFVYGPGRSPGAYWHTREDTLDKVCAESLDAVGEAALIALRRFP